MSSLAMPLITAKLGLKTKKKKYLSVEVCTKESKYVFDEIPIDATGRDIFERICRAIGLRETYYFGLQYIDNKNAATWLDLKKKIVDQNVVFDRSALMPNAMINHVGQYQHGFWSANCPPSPSPSGLSLSASPLSHQHLIDQQHQSLYQNTFRPNCYGNINGLHHRLSNPHVSVTSNNSTSDYSSLSSHHHQYHPSLMTSASSHHLYSGSGPPRNGLGSQDGAPKSLTNLTTTNSYSSENHQHYLTMNQYNNSLFLQQDTTSQHLQSLHPFKRMQHLQASPPGSHQNDTAQRNYLHYNGNHFHHFASCSHGLYGSMKTTARITFEFLIKEYIIEGKIDCTYEKCIRLAALAAQAKFGEFDEKSYRPGMLMASHLLPKRFVQDYQQGLINSAEEEIKRFYVQFKNLSQEEAEHEYLGIAKNLPKCGVTYFPVKGKNGMDLWLGVTALGLSIYDRHDQNQPKIKLIFSEIRNLIYNKKKFTIERWSPVGKDDIVLYSDRTQNNEQAYYLCIGYHELFMMRERPETLEMKQMKAQAVEEKQRRLKERAKLVQEKEIRRELEHRLRHYEEENQSTHQMLFEQQREARKIAEEARKEKERADIQARRAAEAEREVQRMKTMKTEQEKSHSEVDEAVAGIAVNNALGAICDVKDIYSRTMSANNNNNSSNNNPGYNNVPSATTVNNYHNNVVMQSTKTNNDNNNNNANNLGYVPITKVINPQISFYFDKDINQSICDYERDCLDYEKKAQDLNNHLHSIAREVESLKRDNMVSSIYETNI